MGIEPINHFAFRMSRLLTLIFTISTKQGFNVMS